MHVHTGNNLSHEKTQDSVSNSFVNYPLFKTFHELSYDNAPPLQILVVNFFEIALEIAFEIAGAKLQKKCQ